MSSVSAPSTISFVRVRITLLCVLFIYPREDHMVESIIVDCIVMLLWLWWNESPNPSHGTRIRSSGSRRLLYKCDIQRVVNPVFELYTVRSGSCDVSPCVCLYRRFIEELNGVRSQTCICAFLPSFRPDFMYPLRVGFLLKIESGYLRDAEVTRFTLVNPYSPFALTPIGQLHQSPPSPVPGDLGRCPSHQSHATRT